VPACLDLVNATDARRRRRGGFIVRGVRVLNAPPCHGDLAANAMNGRAEEPDMICIFVQPSLRYDYLLTLQNITITF